MPEPVTLAALGVALGKLLLRWGDLNDTADALEDAQAGFKALLALRKSKAETPVGVAITEILQQRMTGVRAPRRREGMQIAVANVADMFTNLTDDDILAAAQDPGGFTRYLTRGTERAPLGDTPEALARGPARILLANTEDALTPFTTQLIATGAQVFAELAPRSGRFTAAALVRLLNQVAAVLTAVTDVQHRIATARDDLLAAQEQVARSVEALHPKVDQIHPKLDELLRSTRSPASAVEASRLATRQGRVVGAPITGWDPGLLGVHASITVHDETTLIPYVARAHDHHLRSVLAQAAISDRPSLVLVVGTSCAGKTRSLYEAVNAVMPDWQVTTLLTDSALAQTLAVGIPARTLVWLDELQDRLTITPSGITAAQAVTELLSVDDVGPIVFAGTLWPTNLKAMQDRPDPDKATAGAGIIPDLLEPALVISVPDVFTDTDLEQPGTEDPRLQLAITTASFTSRPDQGRKITQVLAGGTQLVHRLYPPVGTYTAREFTPAAKALLHAACDLRRVGFPSPLPKWALVGAAPGYLDPPDHRPVDQWLPRGLDEVTQAARDDDPLTDARTLDIYRHGVPALSPRWTATPAGESTEAYELHDYLYQHELSHRGDRPTTGALWGTLTQPQQIARMRPDTLTTLARSAEDRGLTRYAIALWRAAVENHEDTVPEWMFVHIASLGDVGALAELRSRAEHGVDGQEQLAEALGALAERGDPAAWEELRERSALDRFSRREMMSLVIAEGRDTTVVAQPPPDPPASVLSPRNPPVPLSIGHLRSPLRSRAEYAYLIGDMPRLLRLRKNSPGSFTGRRVARLLVETDRIGELVHVAETSQAAWKAHVEYESYVGLSEPELHELAATNHFAAKAFGLRLLRANALQELARWAQETPAARAVLVRHYASSGDIDGLKRCIHSGYGLMALQSLRLLYGGLGAGLMELDPMGDPA